MPVSPGDPLTPGIGAKRDAKRLPIDSALGITKIPVLPISYGDAQPLLAAVGGPVAPGSFRGGLPITYHVGPGPARVHLKVKADWKVTQLYDVIARVPGSDAKDEWVLRGNHHDAWVNGAEDPISGQIALLEEARAMGALMKQGWRPRRTIVFAAWDGEEEGLLGSTEFAEQHAEELRQHAVVYINSDGNGRGFLGAAGSHTLENAVNDVAREITDPETGLSVWKRLQLSRIANGAPSDRKEARERANLRIGALGSGSDYSPFLQHLGIASLDLGFGGEEPNAGVYHSIYDSFAYYTRFDDTNFVYGRALAQLAGTLVMRLANADVLPYRPADFAETVGRYVDEVKTLATTRRDSIADVNQQLDEGVFQAISDPRQPIVAPAKQVPAPFVNFAPLENALAALTKAAGRYDSAFTKVSQDDGAALERPEVRAVNATLRDLERSMTDEVGLPGRSWYRHLVYAPGLLTGYGVKTLPAVREAIELGQWSDLDGLVARTAAALDKTSQTISAAAETLEKASNP
jgi:N-acetylated-alpha-linked acidic dipeptidase